MENKNAVDESAAFLYVVVEADAQDLLWAMCLRIWSMASSGVETTLTGVTFPRMNPCRHILLNMSRSGSKKPLVFTTTTSP